MTDRWVCRRCFADNEDADQACARCGWTRGADATVDDQRAWAAQSGRPLPDERPAWHGLLRFWWIPVILVVLAVGYFTTARRGDDGSLATAGSVSVYDLRAGDCFNAGEADELTDVAGVPCDEPHAYEVFAVVDYGGSAYPGTEDAFFAAFSQTCLPAFESYVGTPYEASALYASALTPTEEGWNDGDREFVCYLFEEDESPMTAPMEGSGR